MVYRSEMFSRYPAGEFLLKDEPKDQTDYYVPYQRYKDANSYLIANILMSEKLPFIFLPYLPYSREDKEHPYRPFALKTIAQLLNSQNKPVVTFDVHSSKAREYINQLIDIPIDTIIQICGLDGAFDTLVIPDEGALTRTPFIDEFKNVVMGVKERNPNSGSLSYKELVIVKGELRDNAQAIVIDDICDGGRTFELLRELLPKKLDVWLFVTHGFFSKGTETLADLYNGVFTTDTVYDYDSEDFNVKCYPLWKSIFTDVIRKQALYS